MLAESAGSRRFELKPGVAASLGGGSVTVTLDPPACEGAEPQAASNRNSGGTRRNIRRSSPPNLYKMQSLEGRDRHGTDRGPGSRRIVMAADDLDRP